jgi:hypothetical protein
MVRIFNNKGLFFKVVDEGIWIRIGFKLNVLFYSSRSRGKKRMKMKTKYSLSLFKKKNYFSKCR